MVVRWEAASLRYGPCELCAAPAGGGLVFAIAQIVKKTVKEEKKDSDYGDRAQAHYDKMKKRKKAALKT